MSDNILGAVASNAGDEFHEIWALRAALSILDRQSKLTALTLEGVRVQQDENSNGREWDGVDCALYFGGTDLSTAERVELIQLKYSVADSNKAWTLSRLIHSSAKSGNNSVARRLGNAFKAAKEKTKATNTGSISAMLVTNQPIAADLQSIVFEGCTSSTTSDKLNEFRNATGLSRPLFSAFCKALSLKGSEEASATLKANVVGSVAAITDIEVQGLVADLRLKVREMMLPPAARTPISRETLLSWLGVGEPYSLFPCQSELESIDPIPRKVVTDLADAIKQHRLVCLDGSGGCGKTTSVQSVVSDLPAGSEVFIYDCYGAGRYLDRSQTRHRPVEVFTQIANELALRFRLPVFLPYKENANIAASFRRRLKMASEVLLTDCPGALLVLILDAADNAVFAASKPTPHDPCAVFDFLTLSDLPDNVRLVVSARTSRLPSLKLPLHYHPVTCGPFELNETGALVQKKWPETSDGDIRQFHHLSNQVPRVQVTTLAGADDINAALNLLRPNGQNLDGLFESILRQSIIRMGGDGVLDRFCSALSVLTTPAPPGLLATLSGEQEAFVREVCDDLSPNVRLTESGFEFANEDFEQFIRQAGQANRSKVVTDAAELLYTLRHTSAYAAVHVADLLSESGRAQDLYNLIDEPDSTQIITDKVERRRADLHRLQAAISVASLAGDMVQAGKIILIGAEAIRAEDKVYNLLINNFQLAVEFSETAIRHEILRDSSRRQYHGPVLMHLAAKASGRNEAAPFARECARMAIEWVLESNRPHADDKTQNWRPTDLDLFALGYAETNLLGWEKALEVCNSWTPLPLRYCMLLAIIELSIKRDGFSKILTLRSHLPDQYRWFTTVALVRAGQSISKSELDAELTGILAFDFSELRKREPHYHYEEKPRERTIADQAIFFAEICKSRGCNRDQLMALASKIWPLDMRRWDAPPGGRVSQIDFTVRCELLARDNGDTKFDIEKMFRIDKASLGELPSDSDNDKKLKRQKLKQVDEFITKVRVVEKFHQTINSILISPSDTLNPDKIKEATFSIQESSWRNEDRYELRSLKELCCEHVADIAAICSLPVQVVIEAICTVFPEDKFGQNYRSSFGRLLFNPSAFDLVTSALHQYAQTAISHPGPANTRADVLTSISQLILPNSVQDAKPYFEEAVKLLDELDVEVVDQILFTAKSANKFEHNNLRSRSLCSQMAAVMEHTAVILDGESEFPYAEIVKGLGSLSLPVALCALSKWADIGFLRFDNYFDDLLRTGIKKGVVDPAYAAALSYAVSQEHVPWTSEILDAASASSEEVKVRLLEELSCRGVILNEASDVLSVGKELTEFATKHGLTSTGLRRLGALTQFIDDQKSVVLEPSDTGRRSESPVPLKVPPFDCSTINPVSRDEILKAINDDRQAKNYRTDEILRAIRTQLIPSQRIGFLSVLAELIDTEDYPVHYFEALIEALNLWQHAGVQEWTTENIPQLIVRNAGWALRYGWSEGSYFEPLVNAANLNDQQKVALIVKVVESNSQQLGSRSLFRYGAFLLQSLPISGADALFGWYLDRWQKSKKANDGIVINTINIDAVPISVSETVTLLIYRLMGDADSRIRWKAAHATRSIVRLGNTDFLPALISCRRYGYDFPFAANTAPFHFLTAKTWLAMTLGRIAFERPEAISANAEEVLKVATDGPPHALIEHHIKRVFEAPGCSGFLSETSQKALDKLLHPTGGIVTEINEERKFERYGFHASANTRFHFDSMDVLPYWYNTALRVFANVTADEFLLAADRWIVDHWAGDSESSNWNKEQRQNRLNGQDSHAGHGSYPIFERHSVYLQWHAMFTVVSELMQTRPIAGIDRYGANPLAEFIERWDITSPSRWISDLRTPKPIDPRYWQKVDYENDAWLDNYEETNAVYELMSPSMDTIFLAADRDVYVYSYGTQNGKESVEVESALVDGATAQALLRSIQTVAHQYNFYLPFERDDDLDDEGIPTKFRLQKSYSRPTDGRDPGFDNGDPLRNGGSNIRALPTKMLQEALIGTPEICTTWAGLGCPDNAISYRSWADLADNISERDMHSVTGRLSNGYVLAINKNELLLALSKLGLDLIFTVKITRERGNEYGRHKQEDSRRSHFGHVYLLRRDGTFEDIDGRISLR